MSWRSDLPGAAQLPTGLAGMVNHENRLLSEPHELLTANGVSMDDLYVRKEPGTVAYDTSGLASAPLWSGTQSSGNNWTGALVTFAGSGIAVGGTAVADSFVKLGLTTSRTIVVPVGGYATDSMVIVVVSCEAFDGAAPTGCSDTDNNAYTRLAFGPAAGTGSGAGRAIVVFYTKLPSALLAGEGIQLTFPSGPIGNIATIVGNFTGLTGVHDQTASNFSQDSSNPTALTVGPTGSLSSIPQLLVAGIGNGNAGNATITPDAGPAFTELLETTDAAVTADTAFHYRIDTTGSTIIGLWDWYSDAETTPAGTVSTTAGDTTVTGVGTTFTNHAPGDRIVINNETRVIETITSATVLDTTVAWNGANAGVAYSLRVGNRIITASTSGNLFKEKPLTLTTGNIDAVTLASGLSLTARQPRFVVGGKEAATLPRKLFYFNGVDPVQVLAGDGTSMAAITAPPTDWDTVANQGEQPINGLIHENRLVAWGNLNDPHRVYASDPDDHEDFTTAAALTIRFRSDIGDRIWCGASFQGIFFVWKHPRGIMYLDDTDLDPTNWTIRVKSEAIGCAPSPFAALPIDDDVLFMAADGTFHLLTAVDAFGGTQASDITRRLGLNKWIRENLNLTRLHQTLSVWYPQKKLAVFTVPSTDSEVNDLTLKFDFSGVERDLPIKFSYSERDTGDGLAIRRAPAGGPETPILGQSSFVFLLDQEARNANGVAYTGQYQLPHLDFAHLAPQLRWHRKQFEALELIMEPVDAGTLTVEVFVDGTLRQTLSYDATQKRQRKKLNCGDGYTFSIRVTNSALDEDFKVLSHLVWFKPGNEDQNR